ncbi:MAG: asparagine synthase (glutamine-hydrolyzing) [Planctomycetota bacterium]
MCGLFGIAASRHREPSLNDAQIVRLRDRLRRRGPDDAGLWRERNVVLAHRRLAIVDPVRGMQPLSIGTPGTPEHGVLIYNGELYNHREIRTDLEACGARFETNCDSEVVGRALAAWGEHALDRMRGMFALAWYRPAEHHLLLARDPLGIKPLYHMVVDTPNGREIAFASEPIALIGHPYARVAPDWAMVSAYLSSIRTSIDDRSMFEGVSAVRPGGLVRVDLSPDVPAITTSTWHSEEVHDEPLDFEKAASGTREAVLASVEAHLMGDAAITSMLSGGLDSAIITAAMCDRRRDVRTYCAGAVQPDGTENDLHHAAMFAEALETIHTTVPVDRGSFEEVWPWMIGELGVPLSTPNEVAIYLVAKQISAHGKVVLSGEGADELFGGYGPVLHHFALTLSNGTDAVGRRWTPARAYLSTCSWIACEAKAAVLTPDICEAADDDVLLRTAVQSRFVHADDGPSALRACLRAQRDFNLTGLLGRLDTATMLASVEGRTPFADIEVARFAAQQPFAHLVQFDAASSVAGHIGEGMIQPLPPTATKRLLRHAFADVIPPAIINRPKASFPLPFQSWLSGDVSSLWQSAVVRDVFCREAIQRVHTDPSGQWQSAWPMLNIAMWLQQFWGSQSLRVAA